MRSVNEQKGRESWWIQSAMRVWVELCKNNGIVTDAYLRAIGEAYGRLGGLVNYGYNVGSVRGSINDVYVVAEAPSAYKLILKGCKKVVYWAQGVWPEESYGRNRSKTRLLACNFVEKHALKGAFRVFLVSEQQRQHYEKKYSISLQGKSFVMACSNETLHVDSFRVPGKYDTPVFLYAGSLAAYQCIDETINAFSQAQEVFPEASLLFLTPEQSEAKKLIDEHGLRNVTIGHCPQEQLAGAISCAKYGFVIRDDSIVNRIATPTKISTYIANGIIPIYSSSLTSFSASSTGIPRLEYRKGFFGEDLASFEKKNLIAEQVLEEYEKYFRRELDYFSKRNQIDNFLSL